MPKAENSVPTLAEVRSQIGKDDVLWVHRPFRKVSILLTWALLHTRLTPNGATILGMLLGVAATVLMAVKLWAAGCALLLLAVLLDYSDGEISRYRGSQSKEGSYLDKIYHFTVVPAAFAGLAIGSETHPAIGMLAVIGSFVFPMVVEYIPMLVVFEAFRQGEMPARAETSSKPSRWHELGIIWDFPLLPSLLIAAIVTGTQGPFLWFYGTTFPILIAAAIWKKTR